jgi:hypothetical protein
VIDLAGDFRPYRQQQIGWCIHFEKRGGFVRKATFVIMLVVGSAILGATVFSERIAQAAQLVSATIIGPLDDLGNLRVHEQGTVVIRDPEAAREPWHVFLGPNDEYVVPAGKRLVIEYANGIAQVSGATQPDWTLSINETGGGQGYHFTGISLFNCTNCYVMSEQLRLYAPAGSSLQVGVVPAGSVLRLSGYLIDVP